MAFLTEAEPQWGIATDVAPGIRRVVARNPSPMTYHGTNSYLIETPEGLVLLDPGPDDASHVAALLAAADGRLTRILISHTHHDHIGALPAIRAATGVPVCAYMPSAVDDLVPDLALADGQEVAGLTAIFTPGHAADHLCFARADGVVFSADHVMSWSTSVVGPPRGDMAAYFASLHKMLARNDSLYLPGHGPPHPNPRELVEALLFHRTRREESVLRALNTTPRRATDIVSAIYGQIAPGLHRAAERSVTAHLIKLEGEGRARHADDAWLMA